MELQIITENIRKQKSKNEITLERIALKYGFHAIIRTVTGKGIPEYFYKIKEYIERNNIDPYSIRVFRRKGQRNFELIHNETGRIIYSS